MIGEKWVARWEPLRVGHGGARWGPLRGGTCWSTLEYAAGRDTVDRAGVRCGAGHDGARWDPLRGGTRWIALGSAAGRDTVERAGKAKESFGKLGQARES